MSSPQKIIETARRLEISLFLDETDTLNWTSSFQGETVSDGQWRRFAKGSSTDEEHALLSAVYAHQEAPPPNLLTQTEQRIRRALDVLIGALGTATVAFAATGFSWTPAVFGALTVGAAVATHKLRKKDRV